MYIRFNKKAFLILSLGILTFVSDPVYANDPGEDSVETVPLRKFSIGMIKKSFQTTENPSNSIVPPVSKGIINNFLSGLSTGGYYRGYFYSRKMTDKYGNEPTKAMSVGDGYYDPTMFLYVGGNPTANTSIGSELIIANPFEVYRGAGYYTNGAVKPYNTLVLRGTMNTKLGDFSVVAGGIEWLRLTPFTFGSNVGFNRYSIFERRPWDPVGNIKTRYASYYYSGNLNQDTRWGTQAFKGFSLNGFLPKLNTNIDVFYGKTAFNGGINRENTVKPSRNLGIRIKKNLKNSNYISFNTFNSFVRSDSINSTNDIQWNIFTSEFSFNYKGIVLNGEVGGGRYMSPTYPEKWGEGILLDLLIPKKFTAIPINLRYFQIGQSFTSNVANFNNTTIAQVSGAGQGQGSLNNTPFGSNLDNVGSINNNRRGGALNTNIKVGKFVITAGTQISADLDKLPDNSKISFSHRINNLVWSRLPGVYPLNGKFGPNNRVGTYYRGAYETVNISDLQPGTDSILNHRRYYNSIDLQLKYKEKIFNRDLYIYYLGSTSSVQGSFSPITKFNNDAYISAQFHEMDVYYQIHRSFIIALYAGLERIKGNQFTDLGPNGKPRDQTGEALGIGFDFAISNQTTLFFRQRWFSFEDKNFPGEKFNGNEATLELKIFF